MSSSLNGSTNGSTGSSPEVFVIGRRRQFSGSERRAPLAEADRRKASAGSGPERGTVQLNLSSRPALLLQSSARSGAVGGISGRFRGKAPNALRGSRAPWCLFLMMVCAGAASAAGRLPRLTSGQMREDLIYVRDVWKPQDRSFDPAATRAFDRIIDRAIAVPNLDPLGFWMSISRALAVSGNGHTNVDGDIPPFPGLPFNAWWFRDGLYIVQTQPRYDFLLGARIEKIGKDNPQQALAAVTPFISGRSTWIKTQSPGYLRIPALLHRLGITRSDTSAQLTVRLRGGEVKRVMLPLSSEPDPTTDQENWRALMPAPASQKGRWPGVLDTVKPLPLTYRAPVDVESRWLGPDHHILYIRSNQIERLRGKDLGKKLADMIVQQVAPQRPKSVIVDLRFNWGGNFVNTILFAQALPKLLPAGGHDYVLVSGSSFSAAIVAAAMLKESGGNRVVLLGTPMGDNGAFWAEGRPIALPQSRLELRPAPQFEDWSQGCHDIKRCFWPDVVWGPKSRISLQPEFRISPTFAEYAAGQDPVLAKAMALSR
jgi:hypothetical protein